MSLYVVKVYSLSCDAPGCDEYSDDDTPMPDLKNKARATRRRFEAEGWRFENGRDLCPKHSPEKGQP